MQLKRILARDSRSATEKAIALYGSDVLIISNHLVNGQTELVVALDLPASEPAASALPLGMTAPATGVAASASAAIFLPDMASVRPGISGPGAPAPATFLDTLRDAQWKPSTALQAQPPQAHHLQPAGNPEDARDYLRGREIVDLVRDELASLRREFRLGQQTAGWQHNMRLAPAMAPLAQALGEAAIPQELRALMLDTLQDHATPEQALQALGEQLRHALTRPLAHLPTAGVHLLAGPSGAGKTLMAARLALRAEQLHGAHQVAIISYQDVRAGAWSQVQMLASQLGIDCYRAGDSGTLALLLNELAPRRLVLIDTPGVQMNERVAEILALHPACGCHAVIPADASSATLRKLDKPAGASIAWSSLLISKLDECTQPWPLLHFLSNNSLALAGASEGVRPQDLLAQSPMQRLVALGLAQLQAAAGPTPARDMRALAAGAAVPVATMARPF